MAGKAEYAGLESLDPATIAVRDLVGASRELVGRMARLMGMNANDMSAIAALSQHGPMGVVELAEHLGIRSASATTMVDRLEDAGHVVRNRDAVDRRRVTITETAAAQQANADAWGPLIAKIDDVARALDGRDRDAVCRFLIRVTEVTAAGGEHPAPDGTSASDEAEVFP